VRAFLTPRWLGLHALFLAAVLVLCRIGLWQWDKGGSDGRAWQHFGYAVQWWLFAAFAVFLWVKLVLDEKDPEAAAERRRTADPTLPVVRQPQAPAPADDEDDELAAYNRHLAWLAENGRR
jgi:DNA-binding transcriptional regulator of glucitol operon